jgi:hypothetical protein
VSRSWRVTYQWQTLLLCLTATRVAFAGWGFTPPGDPNRNWTACVTSGGSYDDNFNSTEKNRQAGLRFNSDVRLRASVPLERLFMGLNYDYGVQYPRDIQLGGVNETHNLTFSGNYIVNPRLTLGLNGNYVSSIQAQLVQTQAGVPVTVVQAGDYVYNNVGGNLSYALTPRWNLALNGSWSMLGYQVPSVAEFNDHEDYQATVSAIHAFGPRTAAGVNYQYGQTIFLGAGTNNIRSALDAQSHTGYLSLVERFNPRLSLQLNGGYTIRETGDGSVLMAPSANGSLVYNYGPSSTISAILGHALTQSSLGFMNLFSTAENTTFSLQANHRLTARLRVLADASYVYGTFAGPILTPTTIATATAQQQSLTGHLGFNYAFRDWVSVVLDYYYTRLSTDVPGLSFDRTQVNLGLSLTY